MPNLTPEMEKIVAAAVAAALAAQKAAEAKPEQKAEKEAPKADAVSELKDAASGSFSLRSASARYGQRLAASAVGAHSGRGCVDFAVFLHPTLRTCQ